MGNTAIITTRENFENNGIGIYIHWHGGRDSVEPFLEYCRFRKFRSPDEDCYGWARLAQVIANFFGGYLSIGIGTLDHLSIEHQDNGIYIIQGWRIIDRQFMQKEEQKNHGFLEMLLLIDAAQPLRDQLGPEFLKADEYLTEDLRMDDLVWVFDEYYETYKRWLVAGFAVEPVSGRMLPYVQSDHGDLFLTDPSYKLKRPKF